MEDIFSKDSVMNGYQEIENVMDKAQFAKKVTTDHGFDTNDSVEKAFNKITEEYEELKVEVENYIKEGKNLIDLQKEMGDVLFAICGLANKLDIRAEDCLDMTVNKFVFRTCYIEKKLKEKGQDFSNGNIDEMCQWWNEAKQFI